jgi:hypothetical protein
MVNIPKLRYLSQHIIYNDECVWEIGSVISMESCSFIFCPMMDGPTFGGSASSSSLLDFDRSMMSSTNTFSPLWVCLGPIVSSRFAGVSGLWFEVSFRPPELCPISPCCVVVSGLWFEVSCKQEVFCCLYARVFEWCCFFPYC